MKSFFDKSVQHELLGRMEKLTSESQPLWGKMNVAQMLAHCVAAMQLPLGELPIKKSWLSVFGPLAKWVITNELAFLKNLPTAKEFKVTDSKEFLEQRKRYLEVFEKLSDKKNVKNFTHPIFGSMTMKDWDLLMYKHLDHHLKQFGV